MRPVKSLQLGKNGLSSTFVEQVRSIFENEKMVKISILKSACRDKDEARKIGEELVEKLGRKFGFKLVGYVLTVMKFRKEQR
jgi:RNA-binding protein YhbY